MRRTRDFRRHQAEKAKEKFKRNYRNDCRAGWSKWNEEYVNDPRVIGLRAITPAPKRVNDYHETREYLAKRAAEREPRLSESRIESSPSDKFEIL